MALDPIGRQYADKLFQQRMEEILKVQGGELTRVRQDHAARNMTLSGNYFTAQAQVYVRNAELLAQARVDSLLDAHKKSGAPLDDKAFAEIYMEVTQFCEHKGRNIVQALTNGIEQSFGNQAPGGFREAISGQVVREISGVSARVTRKLSILQDETKLAARNSAASQTAAQTDSRQSTPTDSADSLAAPKQILHAKPHLYYWRFCQEFGRECYRTWRWELFASLGVSFTTYMITKGDDPLAWRNFKVAFLATVLTLAGFALWHLVRTPWLVHRAVNSPEEATIHWSSGVLGVMVLAGLIVGVYLSIGYLRAVPNPPIVRIVPPPPPATMPQAEVKLPKQGSQPAERGQTKDRVSAVVNEKRCWFANHFGMPNSTIAGAVTATATMIHCNYKIDAPYLIEVEFDRDFIPGATVVLESGTMSDGEGKNGFVRWNKVSAPALLSEQTVAVTVYGKTDQYPRAKAIKVESLK